jgi:hypothetical protein
VNLLDTGDQHAIVWDVIKAAIPGVYVGRAIPSAYPDRLVIVNRDASIFRDYRHQGARFRVRCMAKAYLDADLLSRAVRKALEGVERHDYIVSARRDLGPMDVDDPSGLACIYSGFAVMWRTN